MKKIYLRLSLVMTLLFVVSVAFAQERVVTGTIVDETGSTMPGVNILVKGTSTGTASDAEGKFSIRVPNDQAILVATFVGYMSTEVPVGSRTDLSISMVPDAQSLEEVVVTGYQVMNRRDVTGAVSTYPSGELHI